MTDSDFTTDVTVHHAVCSADNHIMAASQAVETDHVVIQVLHLCYYGHSDAIDAAVRLFVLTKNEADIV